MGSASASPSASPLPVAAASIGGAFFSLGMVFVLASAQAASGAYRHKIHTRSERCRRPARKRLTADITATAPAVPMLPDLRHGTGIRSESAIRL
jgi:hypothetical protein